MTENACLEDLNRIFKKLLKYGFKEGMKAV